MPPFLPLPLALLLGACGVVAPGGAGALPEHAQDPWPDAPDAPRVQIVGDLSDGASGKMRITMHFMGLSDAMDSFTPGGRPPELEYSDVQFFDASGSSIGSSHKGRTWTPSGLHRDELYVQYQVEPGGDGRHGQQGLVTADWASFDGRVFFLPDGGGGLRAGRLRFDAPQGWTTASALHEQDGWLLADVYGPDRVLDALGKSCFGVGPFVSQTRQFGNTEARVFTLGTWPEGDRQALSRDTLSIFGWFYRTYGFDPGFPMAWVWTPNHDGKRVYGGSSANGTCFEQPRPNTRAWQLMAHRIGHSINEYPPSGMHMRDERDAWFTEGWASFVELEGTVGSGVAASAPRWNSLYATYHKTRRDTPERDMPLAIELTARGDTKEFIHYWKCPMVVELLKDWIARRYGKDLNVFMAQMVPRYGGYQAPFPVKEELEAFVGAPLDDFWTLFIDREGDLYPVWDEALTPGLRAAAQQPGAATVNGRAVSGEYLHYLAESGDFARYGDIKAFLEQEEARRIQLDQAGIQLLPPKLEQVRTGFPPETRYALARTEAAYPGLNTAPSLPGGELVLDESTPDGRVFAQLLADEATYEHSMAGTGIQVLAVQAKAKGENGEDGDKFDKDPVLTFTDSETVRLQAVWAWKPGSAGVAARRGDELTDQRTVTIAPAWTQSWSVFEPRRRPKGDGIVTFQVTADGHSPVFRSFWQRGS